MTDKWQPIDAAPVGEEFLACIWGNDDYGYAIDVLVKDSAGVLWNCNSMNIQEPNIWTHWQSKPDPPETE